MVSFLAQVKNFRFWPKTMDYNKAFLPKSRLYKTVCIIKHTHCLCVYHCRPPRSIEEDFVTWKEGLWPVVCEQFGMDSSLQSAMAREYTLTLHSDLPTERVFAGEPHRLGSYQNQKS